ncbi:TLD domain-containing protein 1 [Vitis vinifera]|uniref:TLD domain-containing protein 1 n=1 Tax=Vitis vinifera TaxID=29760 RepID=A0A438BP05_VITVI|nr:TLD domain-containing protein 1 [Vitis vinifera]
MVKRRVGGAPVQAFNDWEVELVEHFLQKIQAFRVQREEEDRVIWIASRCDTFTVKSLYSILEPENSPLFPSGSIWRVNVPPKVTFFAWEASRDSLLFRKETLLGWHEAFVGKVRKKAWQMTPLCIFWVSIVLNPSSLGTYEKGSNDDIEEFIYRLLDVNSDGIVGRSDLEAVLTVMLDDISSQRNSEPGYSPHEGIIKIFLNAATFSKIDEGCAETCMYFEDFRSWCSLLPSVRKYLGSLLMSSDSGLLPFSFRISFLFDRFYDSKKIKDFVRIGRPGYQVPHLMHPENIDSSMIIAKKEYAWHIGGALPQQELEEWKLLYHSAFHGLSFNTFLGNISYHDERPSVVSVELVYADCPACALGPTVLIIKDKEGYVYGGYASQPWERHGDFYGDMKSFLFQIFPKASIFKPTGANSNIQWALSVPSWRDAMLEEIMTLKKSGTWEFVDLPSGNKTAGCKCMFIVKDVCFNDKAKYNLSITFLNRKLRLATMSTWWKKCSWIFLLGNKESWLQAQVDHTLFYRKSLNDLGPMKYLIGMEVARSKRVSWYSKGSIPLTYSKKSVSLEVNQHVLQSRQIIRLGFEGECAVNFSSDSIPNGIGFGGRVNHFGLFLSASFDEGQTFTCTTFGSPCLSNINRIHPEVIECWGVVPKGAQQERHETGKGTILERFKEDRHMLNMVGLANSSE